MTVLCIIREGRRYKEWVQVLSVSLTASVGLLKVQNVQVRLDKSLDVGLYNGHAVCSL